jgi:hypothetical protein
MSVPQAVPSKTATVKPAAAASAIMPRTQRDSRTAMRTMVLQSSALIARNKGVVSRLHPSRKSYKATFTALCGSLKELLAQLLEIAARWSPNHSIVWHLFEDWVPSQKKIYEPLAFWIFLISIDFNHWSTELAVWKSTSRDNIPCIAHLSWRGAMLARFSFVEKWFGTWDPNRC